jgi:Ser-tRNA(Ala) deacylase AlaX
MADAKTEALYQKDGHLYTHTVPLSSLSLLSSLPEGTRALFKPPQDGNAEPYVLTTPSTIFHAQGGGQPSDTGIITSKSVDGSKFVVHQVRKVGAPILHMGVLDPSPSASQWKEGAALVQNIDVEKRVLHSRLHTAGHVIGLAIALLSRMPPTDPTTDIPATIKDGKASHYPGAAFVEFIGLIPSTAKSAIQAKVDELVASDLPVHIHFWSEEEAGRKCIGGTDGAAVPEGEESVRVVDLGGVGSYPCGGTHVKTLKELGKVVVRNVKRQKGVSKVGYDVAEA